MGKGILLNILLLAFSWSASAQVLVNEIAWMGGPAPGVDPAQEWRYEWIELYNSSDSPISLQGWSIELYRAELDFHIALSGTIFPKGYALVGASEKIPGVTVNYQNLGAKLHNAGQRVLLRDATGVVVEELDARDDGWFAGNNEEKRSMERRFPERSANDPQNWGASTPIGGTPKAENSIIGQEYAEKSALSLEDFTQDEKRIGNLGFLTFPPGFLLALLLGAVNVSLVFWWKGRLLGGKGRLFDQQA